MGLELIVAVIMIAFDGGLLDGAVHAFDLAIRPRVFNLGQAVLDAILTADTVEDVVCGIDMALMIGELDAVIGQYGMDGIGEACDQVAQELCRRHLARLLMQLDVGEL